MMLTVAWLADYDIYYPIMKGCSVNILKSKARKLSSIKNEDVMGNLIKQHLSKVRLFFTSLDFYYGA